MKKVLKSTIIPIILTLPVILWAIAPSIQPKFGSGNNLLISMGQITGLVAAILFSLNFILATRLKVVDELFSGLNKAYLKHSQFGQIAFVLSLIHPFLLLSKYANNLSSATEFLWLNNNWPINWGILAIWLMILLITLTIFWRPKYHIWKLSHKFFGLAFLLITLHIWFIPSDVTRFLPLRIYMLAFTSLGLAAFLYRSILANYLVKKFTYQLVRVTKLGDNVTEIIMKPTNNEEKINFFPGQFVFITFLNKNISAEEHPFSLTSAPNNNSLSIAIKKLGDYTTNVDLLSPNTIAKIEGPFGHFSYTKIKNNKQIWIAGGIGITPFISMLNSLSSNNANIHYEIDLYYCVKNKKEAVYMNRLKLLANRLNNTTLKIVFCFSQESGHLSVKNIQDNSQRLEGKDILICAPPTMIFALRKQLINAGIGKNAIHSEEFNL